MKRDTEHARRGFSDEHPLAIVYALAVETAKSQEKVRGEHGKPFIDQAWAARANEHGLSYLTARAQIHVLKAERLDGVAAVDELAHAMVYLGMAALHAFNVALRGGQDGAP